MLNWLKSAYDKVSGTISNDIRSWVHDVVAGLYSFLHIIFGDVGKAWHALESAANAALGALDEFGNEVVNAFEHLYHVWIPDIIKWVTNDILDPLLKAVYWIAHEGAEVYHYITHPGQLVALLWDSLIANLEARAEETAEKLGGWLFTLITRNAAEFAKMIEDILDAIL